MTTSQKTTDRWTPPPTCRPPLGDPRLDFVAEAERFAREQRGRWCFRFLKAFTRCSEGGLDQLLGKLYCESLPQFFGGSETLGRSALKALAQPFYFILHKSFLWRTENSVVFDLELNDPAHLEDYYGTIYDRLPRPKRVTPSARALHFPGSGPTAPISSTVTPRTLAWLFAAPLAMPSLWLLSHRLGRNILAPFRRALGTYATFEGHFRRYPCRHFVTYEDTSNHPCRYFAFNQNCPGKLVVIQNGHRTYHPVYAFGMVDAYFAFGRYLRRLLPELRTLAPLVLPLGALNLDRWHSLHEELGRGPREPLYDVLLLDQGIWPYNGQDEETGRVGFEKLWRNLNEYKLRHPAIRLAIQLRTYGGDAAHKAAVRAAYARLFTEPAVVLENEGAGESYRSVFRSRVVVTFSSTLGFEAFFFGPGTRTLFANNAGNPFCWYSSDDRFQLYDPTGDYSTFERKLDCLLALDLPEPPESVRDQHEAFDGRLQKRIAAALRGRDFA